MRMKERTKEKLGKAMADFINNLIRIADEENYDRDSFIKASADMFLVMTEISTFAELDPKGR